MSSEVVEIQKQDEPVVLKLSDCRRCATCFRIFTPRRLLAEHWCRCGSGTMKAVGCLMERDIRAIEEDYGWDTIVEVDGSGNVEDGLLPSTGEESPFWTEAGWELEDERLHSRERRDADGRNEGRHKILGLKRWWDTIPNFFRSRNRYQDVIKATRRRAPGPWS